MASSTELGVYHAIHGPRSAWKFTDRPVDTVAVERVLDAAIWAPNHWLTETWRFFVMEESQPFHTPGFVTPRSVTPKCTKSSLEAWIPVCAEVTCYWRANHLN